MEERIYFDQKKPGKIRSNVWNKFHEIFSTETKQKIDNFFFCTKCLDVVDNFYKDSSTHRLARHVCFSNNNIVDESNLPNSSNKLDTESLKLASVHFVVKDLRPFCAIEGWNVSLLKKVLNEDSSILF